MHGDKRCQFTLCGCAPLCTQKCDSLNNQNGMLCCGLMQLLIVVRNLDDGVCVCVCCVLGVCGVPAGKSAVSWSR